jgi:hypothetical protein
VRTFARVSLAAIALAFALWAPAAAQTGGLDGYTVAHGARELGLEQRFQGAVDPASIQANNRSLAAFNRLDGTPGDQRGFEQSLATLRS